MPKEIFISYSRKDTATADRICQALDQAGITYFIDRQGISGGAGFTNVLAEEITKSQIILFIASQNAYQSTFTNKEITFAVNRHKHILPYIIDGSDLPPHLDLLLSDLNWRTIQSHPIQPTLISDILTLLNRPTTPISANTPIHSVETPHPSVKTPTSTTTQAEIGQWLQQAQQLSEQNRHSEAIPLFTKAANHGNPTAQLALGNAYYTGNGVKKDLHKAAQWYAKAAEQGHADAQKNLGWAYKYGDGVKKDLTKAVHWFTKAAEQGHADAQRNLGWAYKCGDGVGKDLTKAEYWYLKAAQNGLVDALTDLGGFYYWGQGFKKDLTKAALLYTKAAEQGNTYAMLKIAEFYVKGIGVTANEEIALKWYTKAKTIDPYRKAPEAIERLYYKKLNPIQKLLYKIKQAF